MLVICSLFPLAAKAQQPDIDCPLVSPPPVEGRREGRPRHLPRAGGGGEGEGGRTRGNQRDERL